MLWDVGPQKHIGFVVASPEYRRDAAQRLAVVVSHVECVRKGSLSLRERAGVKGNW